ncbi:MAG: GlsB/YeaQ/YmgE family stress response membrane protein [Candidatus Daviesbacteria bacterium]|nr:MAG: GlsB/YeaQ/YmgE family stress response membrane protein [Candidatus Daviesbacteria bacterium]
MTILAWLLFGLIVGVVANLLDPHPTQGGMLGAIILGIVGALVGGFLGNLVLGTGVTGFNITSLSLAVLGSLLLLFISRAIMKTD